MKFILKILLLFSLTAQAQLGKEAWHWQFGNKCSLDFSSGVPIVGTSAINTVEGSASVSDPNTGQLLFYTDGTTAWNKNNQQMAYGIGMIGGYGTSTQAALIVPKPGSSTIYYLISADQGGYAGTNMGVHYSIVDMSLNGGLGDITTKNILLTKPPATENVMAVKHCDNKSFWIITHSANSNTFNAYLLNTNGIDSIPVISNIGSICAENMVSGYLKVSPNGSKLAFGDGGGNLDIELFDFNRSNGVLSNPIKIATNDFAYGISFSPDNSKLYASFPGGAYYYIYQYDLSNYTQAAINTSQTLITNGVEYSAMQLATNGKIYVANYYNNIQPTLAVINNPNAQGTNCNFQINAVSFFTGTSCLFGLSNFIDAGYNTNPNDTIIYSSVKNISFCKDGNITLNSNVNYLYNIWSNGDTSNKTTVNSSGIFWVKSNSNSCVEIDTFKIAIKQYPIVNLGNDTGFCSGNIKLAVPNYSSCLWNTGQITNSIQVSHTGVYWVSVNENGCISNDTIIIYPADTSQLRIVYPNIITPNGDNINDYIFFGNDLFTSLHLEIYDRWGKKIFFSDDTQCIWFPAENNEIIDSGTYYYMAQYNISCSNLNQSKTLKGFITVVK